MTEAPTIAQALAAVMSDVGAVAKNDRNQAQNFSFRGIDSVVNAVGPVLRKHGVVMLPTAGTPTVDQYQTRNGAQMTHVLLPVTFTFYGPAGDSVSCSVIGEAADAGDKVMSKAHSVAWRVALLESFAIPTDDPDPDSESHERAPAAPEVDWKHLGWEDQAEHDDEVAEVSSLARKIPNGKAKTELRDWLKQFHKPYSRDVVDEWRTRVADIAAPTEDAPKQETLT